eukprot:17801-Amphidinium_carterae.1
MAFQQVASRKTQSSGQAQFQHWTLRWDLRRVRVNPPLLLTRPLPPAMQRFWKSPFSTHAYCGADESTCSRSLLRPIITSALLRSTSVTSKSHKPLSFSTQARANTLELGCWCKCACTCTIRAHHVARGPLAFSDAVGQEVASFQIFTMSQLCRSSCHCHKM